MWELVLRTYPLDSGVTGIVDEARGVIRVYEPKLIPANINHYETREACQEMCDAIMGQKKS